MGPPIIGRSADGSQVVLRRFDGTIEVPTHVSDAWLRTAGRRVRTGAVVDLETTGLDLRSDPVIEVAVRLFRYDAQTGDVVQTGERYSALQDPGVPIPPRITELTGLTDDDVRGKKIDRERVAHLLSQANLVIAHNARFDRPRLDALVQGYGAEYTAAWACSATHLDWTAKGFPSAKLEILSMYHGFFVEAHRAEADVDALLHLLTHRDHKTGQRYLHELLVNARKEVVRVSAVGAPFDKKDLLRDRRYRWKREKGCWEKILPDDEVEAERAWLAEHVYDGGCRAREEKIPRSERFKSDED